MRQHAYIAKVGLYLDLALDSDLLPAHTKTAQVQVEIRDCIHI